MWSCIIKTLVGVVFMAFALLTMNGCTSFIQQPPIEAFANKLVDDAVIPAVREGLLHGVENLTIQAGAQGINPTYVIVFEGKWVVGVEGRASVGIEGIAGQLQISSATNETSTATTQRADMTDVR